MMILAKYTSRLPMPWYGNAYGSWRCIPGDRSNQTQRRDIDSDLAVLTQLYQSTVLYLRGLGEYMLKLPGERSLVRFHEGKMSAPEIFQSRS